MRYLGIGLLVLFAALLVGGAVWFVWGRLALVSGPPEAVVQDFLRAAKAGDWGKAEGYMTSHMRYRIGQGGVQGMERFAEGRLQPFSTWEIVRVTERVDVAAHGARDVAVVVRLSQPVDQMAPSVIAAHRAYGHIEGNVFVHAHRFVLHLEGRAWRIYQFEEADVQP